MKKIIIVFILMLLPYNVKPQIGRIIPSERRVDWRNPGLFSGLAASANRFICVADYGAAGNGGNDDTNPVLMAIADASNNKNGVSILYFPAGSYLITRSISLGSNIIIKGAGSDKTQLKFLMAPNLIPFVISGSAESVYIPVSSGYTSGSRMIGLSQSSETIKPGDFIEIIENNGGWKQSNASEFNPQDYAGQIVRVESVENQYITIKDKLSISYENSPRARKIYPAVNTGFEDITVTRVSTGKGSGSNFYFKLAALCWLKGVESDNAARYHMEISSSANIEVRGCYFHHAEDYGDGGYGYGIAVNFHSVNCLIEDNIFQRLRHSMLVQLGANRNVFGYNYSREQHSTYIEPISGKQITTTLGDLNLHAHYPYANLFEGNIVEAVTADDYWGDNGPYNTIFRNRITRNDNLVQIGGIHIDASYQNIIGNVLYDISDQFYSGSYTGNFANFNGSPGSMGDAPCEDISYYYENRPDFLPSGYTWPPVGTRTSQSTLTQNNPAFDRWNAGKKTVSALDISKWQITAETPALLIPADGSKDIQLSVKLIWQKIKGAKRYSLVVSSAPDFGNLVFADSSITDTFKTIGSLLAGKQYYWKVSAANEYGKGDYSSAFSFFTLNSSIYSILGRVSYNNQSDQPVDSVVIELENLKGEVVRQTTNSTGFFEFQNLKAGMYLLSCSKAGGWKGVNSADALFVAKVFINLAHFADELQKSAADVNNDSTVNSSDALLIQRRFTGNINAFPNGKPDWIFMRGNLIISEGKRDTVFINNGDETVYIKTICSGDANKSYAK
jgi:hypothetical protein